LPHKVFYHYQFSEITEKQDTEIYPKMNMTKNVKQMPLFFSKDKEKNRD
jgi:hypothetical protein